MPLGISQHLSAVERLIDGLKMHEAEESFMDLLATVSRDVLREYKADIERVADRFYPKRKKRLLAALEEHLRGRPRRIAQEESTKPACIDLQIGDTNVAEVLAELSAKAIFQWDSAYRERLFPQLGRILSSEGQAPLARGRFDPISKAFQSHTLEVFSKGYRHQQSQGRHVEFAVQKSLNGLERFLDLPIAFYTENIDLNREVHAALCLRSLTSAIAKGILTGFAALALDPYSAAALLERNPRRWLRSLGFLTGQHLSELPPSLLASSLGEQINQTLLPLLAAIDAILEDALRSRYQYCPLPDLVELDWERSSRLSIALLAYRKEEPSVRLDCHVILDPSNATKANLEESARRNVALVLASPAPDVSRWTAQSSEVSGVLIDPSKLSSAQATVRSQVVDRIKQSIYQLRSQVHRERLLVYNFAADFPLAAPQLGPFHFVRRPSVRELLRAFSRRKGVRTWCSVRRSGKTTSCRDLANATLEGEAIVIQTCHSPNPTGEGDELFRWVEARLEEGQPIRANALSSFVSSHLQNPRISAARVVLVLDEYETLFNRLRTAAERDDYLRYQVVQPLLNELATFASHNLLIFLGQQPSAHYILMDQNQLSGLVEQDHFPLFEHTYGSSESELGELVRRVLANRLSFTPSFLDALFLEGGGHPFLTVKLISYYLDWLIELRLLTLSTVLDGPDFAQFRQERLLPADLRGAAAFEFFRSAASEALGPYARRQQPWLNCCYEALRLLAQHSPSTLELSKDDLVRELERVIASDFPTSIEQALAEAGNANFLVLDSTSVRPRIPVLCRIAGQARPRVSG